MSEKREGVLQVSLFDQAAEAIKKEGKFAKRLTPQELQQIMKAVVVGWTANQDKIRASLPSLGVKIEDSKGIVSATISVAHPIKANITVGCILSNEGIGDDTKRLKLDSMTMKDDANIVGKAALRMANVEGKARAELRDPNLALNNALKSQLTPRGVDLRYLGLHFNPDNLALTLLGRPLTPTNPSKKK